MNPKILSFLTFSLIALIGCGGGGGADTSSSDTSESGGDMQTAAAVDPATVGTITGSVKYTGPAPKMGTLNMSADAFCKTQHTTGIKDETISVGEGGALKNVYVHVKSGLPNKEFPTPKESVVLDQEGCLYKPHVIGVQTGQTIVIKNSDGVLHNVNARPTNNKPFNIGQPVKGMKNEKVFDKAEVAIPVKCDVHPWMSGYIAVSAHPYFDVSEKDGSFTIKDLPPGNYEIEAWHEKLGTTAQSVTIGAKETKSITFSFGAKS